MLGAIIIAGQDGPTTASTPAVDESGSVRSRSMSERQIPMACVEVLGQPIIARVAENLRRSGIEAVLAFASQSGQLLTSDEACSEEAVAHQDGGATPTWMAEAWSRVEKRQASRQDQSTG